MPLKDRIQDDMKAAMKARETFTKGKGWIKHMGETEMNGKWVKTDEETCKK